MTKAYFWLSGQFIFGFCIFIQPSVTPVSAVSGLILLVFAVPQRYVLSPLRSLGSFGSPVVITALGLLLWWLIDVVAGDDRAWRALTVTPVAMLWVSVIVAAAAGWARVLPALEGVALQRSLVWWAA